jgi:penicillin-binding protein 1C
VNVCARSGQIPGPHCKHTTPTWFIPGVSPLAPCALHRTDGNEAWGSDMRRLFADQGLPRRAQHAPVASSTVPAGGDAPVIVSPQVDTTYHVRVTDASHNTLPLIAHTDAHSDWVHWFLDDAYLGEAAAGDALFWPLQQGAHTLLAVDEQGRATAQRLTVRAER